MSAIAETFGVDWPHLIAQMISFTILCVLLYALAYKPVLKVLAERRRQIAQGLANTEKINAALAAIEEERRQIIVGAQAEATRVIVEARGVAARVREQETQRAVAAAEQIVLKAHDEAANEHARMLADLRRQVGQLVVRTTAAVTGKILDSDDQRRLSEETARQLAA
jgi:F-type H+-transporting ATPase subunit b